MTVGAGEGRWEDCRNVLGTLLPAVPRRSRWGFLPVLSGLLRCSTPTLLGWQLDRRTSLCLSVRGFESLLQEAACKIAVHRAQRVGGGGRPQSPDPRNGLVQSALLAPGPLLGAASAQLGEAGALEKGEPCALLVEPSLPRPHLFLFSSPLLHSQPRLPGICVWSVCGAKGRSCHPREAVAEHRPGDGTVGEV